VPEELTSAKSPSGASASTKLQKLVEAAIPGTLMHSWERERQGGHRVRVPNHIN